MKIIILHDADARIEYLDVADHLLGSDIEEFLTRQGFSVNNITWLVTSADHIPVVYHKYDIDCKTGEATHTKREAELQDLTLSLISAPIISCPKADSSSANTWP